MNGSSVSQVHHSLCLCAFRSMPMRMAFHLKAFLFGIRTHSGHLDMYVLMISSHTLKLAKRPSPQNSLVLRENPSLSFWYRKRLHACCVIHKSLGNLSSGICSENYTNHFRFSWFNSHSWNLTANIIL